MSIPTLNNNNIFSIVEKQVDQKINLKKQLIKQENPYLDIVEEQVDQKIDPKKQLIKYENSYLDIAKEVSISMIPIYGTIHEFQKGNIGWGIFSAVTDVLSLIPFVGLGSKIASSAIKGSRASCIATEALNKATCSLVKDAAQQLSENSAISLSTVAKELSVTSLRAVDPGFELLYKGGTILSENAIKLSEKSSSLASNISNIAKNTPKWTTLHYLDGLASPLKKMPSNFYFDFKLLTPKKLYKQLSLDIGNASEFIVDGTAIAKSTPENMIKDLEKMFPHDFEKVQLISSFAHEGVFYKPFAHKMLPVENIAKHKSINGKSFYNIKNLSNGNVELTARYEANLEKALPHPGYSLKEYEANLRNAHLKQGKSLSSYGIKMETVLSKDKIPEFKYSFYTT